MWVDFGCGGASWSSFAWTDLGEGGWIEKVGNWVGGEGG